MTLKRKTLDRDEWLELNDKQVYKIEKQLPFFKANLALVVFGNKQDHYCVPTAFSGQLLIAEEGITWLEILPHEQNFCITAMFNNDDELFEVYIDITKNNNKEGFEDLYLDLVVHDKEVSLLDENELLEAYNKGVIAKDEYDLAYEVKNDLEAKFNAAKDLHWQYLKSIYLELKEELL